jgi:CelD/BcsL family acetyltransferase involved in cellulose biosynthesis
MSYAVTQETFTSLTSLWKSPKSRLKWGSVFVLPAWLEVWWLSFQPRSELAIKAVREDSEVIGIAPLQVKDGRAFFIGSADVCDYIDFIVVPGKEREFFNVLLDDLNKQGIKALELNPVRPDSTAMTYLLPVAQERSYAVAQEQEAVSLELDLPATWDDYLNLLTKKQRHEVRRKLRRLEQAAGVNYSCSDVKADSDLFLDKFLKLFALSPKEEKANFMNPKMETYFRTLAKAMAGLGFLKFGVLEVGGQPAAMIMGFDYNDTLYLYNSAYNPEYNHLSVGLLSKVLCIRESIQRGRKKWDFLKGAERYKYDIGGQEVPIYHLQIVMK